MQSFVIIEESLTVFLETRYLFLEEFPHRQMIPEIDHESRFALIDIRQEMLRHGKIQIRSRTCTTDCHKETHRFSLLKPFFPGSAVLFNPCNQFVIDIMTDTHNRTVRHRFKRLFRHAVQLLISHIRKWGLDCMDRPFRQMQTHRPVVRNSIDDVCHAGVYRAL